MNQKTGEESAESGNSTPVLGILSIIFASISFLPFLGVISPIALVLGIIALVKKQKLTGIIGTALSVVGIATSPILWALVICSVNPNAELCKPEPLTLEEVQEDADRQKNKLDKIQKDIETLKQKDTTADNPAGGTP